MADVATIQRKTKSKKTNKVAKKRTRNPEEWHKQKQKRLRIAGKEYINANGKLVPPKSPGPDCNCRRRCFQRIPEDIRLKTFQGFYTMKTHDEQNAYLFGLMRQIDIKRKRNKESNRRTCTFEYFIRVKGRETQVCQSAFKSIHAITERKVRVLCKKMDDGVMFPSDNRGKNSHRRTGEVRLPTGVLDQIKEHIYSIAHTHRLKNFIRLDKITGLEINISKMWKDYLRTYDPENAVTAKAKLKKNDQTDVPADSLELKRLEPPQEQIAYDTVGYPGSGHLMNIAENYFSQSPYQQTTAVAPGYYAQQTTSIIFQPANIRPTQPSTAYIVLQPTPAPLAVNPPYQQMQHYAPTQDPLKIEKKSKRKGPTVKQWRYTNIFHDEVNGGALAAIKTRLGLYYAETEAARKKAKEPKVEEHASIQPVTVVQRHSDQGVTIYTE